jgi:hypothetical protein
MLASALYRAVNGLSVGMWNIIALLFTGAFLYSASVAWGDESGSVVIQIAMTLLSVIASSALRCGIGWAGIFERLEQVSEWLEAKQRGECVAVVLILWGAWAWLYPIFDRARDEAGRSERITSRLQSCGLAILCYADDYDGFLPVDVRRGVVSADLYPYVKSDEAFIDPVSGTPFTWRRHFSGKCLPDLANPKDCVIAYSPVPFGGKKLFRAVLFLDGHTKILPEVQFRKAFGTKPMFHPVNSAKTKKPTKRPLY